MNSIEDKTICIKCADYVNYNEVQVDDTCTLPNGVKVIYKRKDALCSVCGSLVFVEEIEDYNIQEPIRIYKEKFKNTNK